LFFHIEIQSLINHHSHTLSWQCSSHESVSLQAIVEDDSEGFEPVVLFSFSHDGNTLLHEPASHFLKIKLCGIARPTAAQFAAGAAFPHPLVQCATIHTEPFGQLLSAHHSPSFPLIICPRCILQSNANQLGDDTGHIRLHQISKPIFVTCDS